MKIVVPVVSLALFLTICVQAEPLSLRQAGQSTLDHHPLGQEALARVSADKARFGQSQAPFYPVIALGTGYLTDRKREDRERSFEQDTSLDLVGSQLLADFGKRRNASKRAELLYQASEQAAEAVRQSLLSNVAQAYFTVLGATQSVYIQKESLRLARLRLTEILALYEQKERSFEDLSLAESDVSSIVVSLLEAQVVERTARVRLTTAMGLTEPVLGPLVNCTMPSQSWDDDEALRAALRARPDLLDIRLRTSSAQSGVGLAKAGYLPDLSLGASYGFLDKGFAPQDYLWEVRLNVSFPILNEPLLSQTVALAKAEEEQAKAREEGRSNDVSGEVRIALINVDASRNKIKAAHASTIKAYRTFTVTWTSYRLGEGSARDVSNAQRDLVDTLESQNRIFTDFQRALVEMHRATGGLTLELFPAQAGDQRNLFWPFSDQESQQ